MTTDQVARELARYLLGKPTLRPGPTPFLDLRRGLPADATTISDEEPILSLPVAILVREPG